MTERYVAELWVTKRYWIIIVKDLKVHLRLKGTTTPVSYSSSKRSSCTCTATVQLHHQGRATSTRKIYVHIRGITIPTRYSYYSYTVHLRRSVHRHLLGTPYKYELRQLPAVTTVMFQHDMTARLNFIRIRIRSGIKAKIRTEILS